MLKDFAKMYGSLIVGVLFLIGATFGPAYLIDSPTVWVSILGWILLSIVLISAAIFLGFSVWALHDKG